MAILSKLHTSVLGSGWVWVWVFCFGLLLRFGLVLEHRSDCIIEAILLLRVRVKFVCLRA